jgi:tetratricopeptide (TPR) repeat protein
MRRLDVGRNAPDGRAGPSTRWAPVGPRLAVGLAIVLSVLAAHGQGPPEATSLLGVPLFAPELPAERRAAMEADLEKARAAQERAPDDPEALLWLGRRTAYLGRYREAVAIFSRGVERWPEDPRFLRHRGHRLITLRRLDEAIADLGRAARMMAGRPDEVEPDGQPNATGIPTSTLHTNIWYHLGLGHFLKGEFAPARDAFAACLAAARNDDMRVAASDWLYMSLRRLGEDAAARKVLAPVRADLPLLENFAYLDRLLLYRGERSPQQLLAAGGDDVQVATHGFGVGHWHLVGGRPSEAEATFRRVVAGRQWAAFGHIAAEAELARRERSGSASLDVADAGRFARLALSCVQQEYPNKIAHVLRSPEDVKPPRALTPAFYGCYDWHSAVHGHWLLARLARTFPEAPFAGEALAALEANLTPEHVAGEVAYLEAPGRETFERPYGLAWLLQLAQELREWDAPRARGLARTLAPLEAAAAGRLSAWLPKLAYPIREGEHAQTAFAFGLVLDWARATGDAAMERMLVGKIEEFHAGDRDCPIAYEPSGQDFLSPCLAEADVMRRVRGPEAFARWLTAFLPRIPRKATPDWLPIGVVTDRSDGKLAHLDGLNLSRAWMLEGIASGLPRNDKRRVALEAAARAHAGSGLAAVTGEHYAGGHWLGSFATYLVTRRGLKR